MRNLVKVTAGIVAAGLIGWIIFQIGSLVASVDSSRRDRADLHQRLDEQIERADQQKAAADALARQIRALGEEPVVEPADPPPSVQTIPIPGRDGAPGRPGRPGANGKPGRDGEAGRDGSNGSPGVAGSQGEPGRDGKDGKDGKDGPPGPPGTVQPGTYTCSDGEYQRGFSVSADGSVNLICAPVAQLPPGGNP